MASLASSLPFLDVVFPGFGRTLMTFLPEKVRLGGYFMPLIIPAFLLFYSWKPTAIFIGSWIRSYCPQPTTCKIPEADPIFDIFMWWVAQQPWVRRARSTLATCDPAARTGFFVFRSSELETEDYEAPFSFSPFDLPLPFWWNGRLFLLERNGRSKKTDDPFVLTLRCLGSTENIRDLLEECRRQYQASQDKCSVFHHDSKGEWHKIANLNPRDLSTIVLPAGLQDQLVRDMQQYLSPKYRKWLEERGLPVRKGYLFYGPPGTGKSSLSQALAKKENINLYVVDLQSLSNEQLSALFRSLPGKCVVLIEDVDDWQASLDSEVPNGPPGSYVTMSAFQNVIDGVSAREGRVVVMTANQREKLDPALIRKGRIDQEIRLAEVDNAMARELFLLIFNPTGQSFGKADQELAAKADQFGQKVPAGRYTAAQILSFLVENKHSPDTALNKFDTWIADS
ncbi:P-loop containing nucleoside triphosphate hydrolase protein [Xylaria palmicola]|nr:P-loop containing nucleoside triphosphate hydrolase protein [Xylaria palmicola]